MTTSIEEKNTPIITCKIDLQQPVSRNAGQRAEPMKLQNGPTPVANNSTLVAYIVLLPVDAEPILATLRALTTRSVEPASQQVIAAPDNPQFAHPEDLWLNHSEAAEYLGVSKSTLYHYACEQRIERRKLGGRLGYRRSTLDKFMGEQVRPALDARLRPSV